MVNQHAKWLKVTRENPWRRPLASLNYLLSSHAWQQDHNAADLLRIHLPALKVRVVNGVTTDPGG